MTVFPGYLPPVRESFKQQGFRVCFVLEECLARGRPLIHLLNKQIQQDMRLSQKRIFHNSKAWQWSVAGDDRYKVWPQMGAMEVRRVMEGIDSEGLVRQPGSRGEE